MPLKLVRDDILHLCSEVDAIVNPTDSYYSGGGGVDFLVHRAAGPDLDRICCYLPLLKRGEANATPGFHCGCKYIFHTCGPVWLGGMCDEEKELISCYKSCLRLAMNNKCASVAFPLISSGTFGYPKDKVLTVAMKTVMDFLANEYDDLMVYIVIYDKRAYTLSSKLVSGIEERITDEYSELHGALKAFLAEGTLEDAYRAWMEEQELIRQMEEERSRTQVCYSVRSPRIAEEASAAEAPEEPDEEVSPRLDALPEEGVTPYSDAVLQINEIHRFGALPEEDTALPMREATLGAKPVKEFPGEKYGAAPSVPKSRRVTYEDTKAMEELLKQRDEGFKEVLLRFIDERGLKDSEAYNRSNVSKSVFNKIVTNPDYRAGKQIVLAFAAGLRLSMDETKELLEKSGHSFTGKPFDIIVRYCLENGIYDISEINAALFQYDLTLLGSGVK